MRKIERDMLDAIAKRKDWKNDNTAVEWIRRNVLGCALVKLHGHTIAVITHKGSVLPVPETFREYPTRTTVSRLRALGVNASAYIPRNAGQFEGTAYIDGEAL